MLLTLLLLGAFSVGLCGRCLCALTVLTLRRWLMLLLPAWVAAIKLKAEPDC